MKRNESKFRVVNLINLLINLRSISKRILDVKPYEVKILDSKKHILIIGDSSAVGIGSSSPETTIAGMIEKDIPGISITNKGVSGLKIIDMAQSAYSFPVESYDAIFLFIGANDIATFQSMKKIETSLRIVIKKLLELSPKVVMAHGGNFGVLPLFPWPLNQIYSIRTRKVRDVFVKLSHEFNVIYVDMYTTIEDFPYTINGEPVYASLDYAFHPNDLGYKLWYEKIKNTGIIEELKTPL